MRHDHEARNGLSRVRPTTVRAVLAALATLGALAAPAAARAAEYTQDFGGTASTVRGLGWTPISGYHDQKDLLIGSGRTVIGPDQTGIAALVAPAQAASRDHTVCADATSGGNAPEGFITSVMARQSGNSFVTFGRAAQPAAGTYAWEIWSRVNGTPTMLARYSAAFAPARICLVAQGDTVKGTLDGVEVASATSTHTGTGVGLHFNQPFVGSETMGVQLDNFSASNIEETTPPPAEPIQDRTDLFWGVDFAETDPLRHLTQDGWTIDGSGENATYRIVDDPDMGRSLELTIPPSLGTGTHSRFHFYHADAIRAISDLNCTENSALKIICGRTPSGKLIWHGATVKLVSGFDEDLGDERKNFLSSIANQPRYWNDDDNGPGNGVGGRFISGLTGFRWRSSTQCGGTTGTADCGVIDLGPMRQGEVKRLEWAVRFSPGTDGYRENWSDGVQVGSYSGPTLDRTNSADNGDPVTFRWGSGYYGGTDVSPTRVIRYGHLALGRTHTSVMPAPGR